MKMMVHVWQCGDGVTWGWYQGGADPAWCCQGKCEGGDQGGVSSLFSRDIILTLGLCGRL